jgi:hypothetical protein
MRDPGQVISDARREALQLAQAHAWRRRWLNWGIALAFLVLTVSKWQDSAIW